jgi:two-component sensor histidine kinase
MADEPRPPSLDLVNSEVVAEFQNRMRNMFAMLRSLIGRSAANKTDVQDYVDHLQARIDAIARTQSSFLRFPGRSIEIEDIIRDEMVSQAADQSKYRVDGPAVELAGKAAEVVTLAIHELATNSVKFGALGDGCGTIEIDWSAGPRDSGEWLRLDWLETGVDLGNLPPPGGFGAELITRQIPYELGGSGVLDFRRDELEVIIEIPLTDGSKVVPIPAGRSSEAAQ